MVWIIVEPLILGAAIGGMAIYTRNSFQKLALLFFLFFASAGYLGFLTGRWEWTEILAGHWVSHVIRLLLIGAFLFFSFTEYRPGWGFFSKKAKGMWFLLFMLFFYTGVQTAAFLSHFLWYGLTLVVFFIGYAAGGYGQFFVQQQFFRVTFLPFLPPVLLLFFAVILLI
ncbi:hypothetical protein [Bacillus sp. FJAT-44742]|uniref:hypothetical protein n=1 Tax=Bacillus sp. FJAT-44742 TaxID=2014005 RepID=UPI0012FEC175|nr:hypothetical protein [Bacillus sp. FJAT-44742]